MALVMTMSMAPVKEVGVLRRRLIILFCQELTDYNYIYDSIVWSE